MAHLRNTWKEVYCRLTKGNVGIVSRQEITILRAQMKLSTKQKVLPQDVSMAAMAYVMASQKLNKHIELTGHPKLDKQIKLTICYLNHHTSR